MISFWISVVPPKSDLLRENAALFMKVSQQEALADKVR